LPHRLDKQQVSYRLWWQRNSFSVKKMQLSDLG
jgi:hypothetical protein